MRSVWAFLLLMSVLVAAGCSRSPTGAGWSCEPGQAGQCPGGYVCGPEGYCVSEGGDLSPTPDADGVDPPDVVGDVTPPPPDADVTPPPPDADVHVPDADVPPPPDADVEPPDADVPPTDADIAPPDADVPPPPDADVEPPDADVPPPPDADVEPPDAEVADVPPCPDPCFTPGNTRCEGSAVATCIDHLDGCLSWGDPVPCDDGDPCNGTDTCTAGQCVTQPPPDCDDGEPCTTDSCLTGFGCVNDPAIDGTPCDDLDPCSLDDACVAGVCIGALTRTCNDGNPCTDDLCDSLLGCVFPAVPDGSPCDVTDPCYEGATCLGGTCQGGVDFCPCHADADCADLDDGNPCNGTYSCNTVLVPYFCEINATTIVVCDTSADGPCDLTACAPASGTCVQTALGDGAACDDGSACTIADQCTGGACAGVLVGAATDDTCDGVDDDCDGTLDQGCPTGPYQIRGAAATAGGRTSDTTDSIFVRVGRPEFQGASFDGAYWVRPMPPGR